MDDAEIGIIEWETYCCHCAGVVAIDAEKCPTCGAEDFDPVKIDDAA